MLCIRHAHYIYNIEDIVCTGNGIVYIVLKTGNVNIRSTENGLMNYSSDTLNWLAAKGSAEPPLP